MSEQAQAQRTIPVETLTQKIGSLVIHNDFLAEEILRVNQYKLAAEESLQKLYSELKREIAIIEADVEKEEESVKSVAKSVIARIKAKL